MDRLELHLPLRLDLIDPYELRIKDAEGTTIGEIYLDDAPVQDYNDRQWIYVKMLVDGANAKPFDVDALGNWLRDEWCNRTCVEPGEPRIIINAVLDKIAELKGKS
ncbi:MAG: hypothetical protein PHQ43_01075 [Dehalococcoidales bacterium]|nr:hypothetical protein [Dehalococcoidales bacterium]